MIKNKNTKRKFIVPLFSFTILIYFSFILVFCSKKEESNQKFSIPENIQKEEIKNPNYSAYIFIDKNGIPYIKANSFKDGLFALGYIMAKMRYAQLDLLRVVSYGMVSSILDIEEARKVDSLTIRTLLNPSSGRLVPDLQFELLQKQRPDIAEIFNAFVEGLNFYIIRLSQDKEKIPPEYESILSVRNPKNNPGKFFFTPQHILAIARFFEWYLTGEGDLALDTLRQALKNSVGNEIYQKYFNEMLTARAGVDIFTLPSPRFLKREEQVVLNLIDIFFAFFSPRKAGSNNWVVSSTLTTLGVPIVANDPHLPLFNPPLWFPWKGDFGGNLIEGFALAGIPGILSGTNGKVAWAVTNGGYDSLDIWKEVIVKDTKCASGFKALHNPSSVDDDECILESTQKIGSGKQIKVFYCPKHGVILDEYQKAISGNFRAEPQLDEGEFLTFRWNGHEVSREVLVYLDILLSEDVQSFLRSASDFEVAPINFVVADLKGNIGYSTFALLPDRNWDRYSFPPIFVLPTDGCCDWKGWVEKSKFPHVINPPKGFIVTANNDLPGYTKDGDPFNDDVYLFWSYDPGYRIAEITFRIEEKIKSGKISLDDIKDIQHDTVSYWTRGVLPFVIENLKKYSQSMNELESKSFSLLSSWDMTCKSGFKLADLEEFSFSEVSDVDIRKNSSACTIFWVFVTKLIKNTFEDEFFAADITRVPPEFEDFFVKQIYFSATDTSKQDFFDDVRTEQKETAEEIIYRSFVSAVSYLSANFGSEPQDWLWGRLAKMKLYHFVSVANLSVYDIGPFPIDLGPVAPAVAWINLVTDDPKKSFIMTGGPSMRSVAYPDSSGVFSIEFAFPGGVSGFGKDTLTKPDKSSHFSDLIPTYFGGDYIKFGKFSRLDDMEKVFILVAEEDRR